MRLKWIYESNGMVHLSARYWSMPRWLKKKSEWLCEKTYSFRMVREKAGMGDSVIICNWYVFLLLRYCGPSCFYTVYEVQFVVVWCCILATKILFSVFCCVPVNDGLGHVLDFTLVYLSKLALCAGEEAWCVKIRLCISSETISETQNTSFWKHSQQRDSKSEVGNLLWNEKQGHQKCSVKVL